MPWLLSSRPLLLCTPDAAGRAAILGIHTRRMPTASDVDLSELARACEGWSGAQLRAMCIDAAMGALREDVGATEVRHAHFVAARERVHAG